MNEYQTKLHSHLEDPEGKERDKAAKKAKEDIGAFVKDTLTDPLTYLGGGAGIGAKGLAKALPMAARGLFGLTLAGQSDEAEAALHALTSAPKEIKKLYSKLKKLGASDQEAFRATGIFKNPRGEYRYYTPDNRSTVNVDAIRGLDPTNSKPYVHVTPEGNRYMGSAGGKRVSDVLNNPTLFNIKPNAANYPVKLLSPKDEAGGVFMRDRNDNFRGIVGINPNTLTKLPEDQAKKSLMQILQHEVGGHGVQSMDNLPNGTSMDAYLTDADRLLASEHSRAKNNLENLANKTAFALGQRANYSYDDLYNATRYLKLKASGTEPSERLKTAFEKFLRLPPDVQQQIKRELPKLTEQNIDVLEAKKASFNKYRSTPGEVEANLTGNYWNRDLQVEGVNPLSLYDKDLIPDMDFYLNYDATIK